MAIGAFRTSPTLSICCEAGIPPLRFRRDALLLNYVSKIQALPQHPCYNILFENGQFQIYDRKPTITRPVSIRARELLETSGILLPRVLPLDHYEIPPWTLTFPIFRYELTKYKKGETNNTLLTVSFQGLILEYTDAVKIYTDGSKTDLGVGSAFCTGVTCHSWKLPSMASVFTAELYAIWQALRFAETTSGRIVVIISDSLSSCQALENIYSENPLVQRIQALISWLSKVGKTIHIIWCPSHIGILGNELVDSAARRTANTGQIDDIPITNIDIRWSLRQDTIRRWQREWDSTEAKLRAIKAGVEKWTTPHNLTRREQVIITRLRIGHTYLTSLYLLRGERQPVCLTCNTSLTIKHILLDCTDTLHIRQLLHLPNTIKECLGNESAQLKKTLEFIRRSNMYNKI